MLPSRVQSATIAGDPGIGKSRLAAELTDRARASGAQVGWGRCWEAGGAPAYWPWAEVLTTLVDRIGPTELRERLGATTDDLAQIVPMLSSEAPDARLAPDAARFRLYEGVVRLCRLSTIDAPLVAVLDDVHVADPSSLLLLQFLAGHLGGMGVLVVATYRDADAMGDGIRGCARVARPRAQHDPSAPLRPRCGRCRGGHRRRDRHRAIETAGREGPRADRRQSPLCR